jgi:hypothetical protein
LACRDICVLGEAVLKEQLPLAAEARRESRTILGKIKAELPRQGGRIPGLAERRVTGGWESDGRDGTFTVWLSWTALPEVVEWFPDPGDGLKISGVTVRTRANLTRLDFKLRRLQRSHAKTIQLRSILTVGKGAARAGYLELIGING